MGLLREFMNPPRHCVLTLSCLPKFTGRAFCPKQLKFHVHATTEQSGSVTLFFVG